MVRLQSLLAVGIALLLSACAQTGTYNVSNYQYQPHKYESKVPGKAAIQMSSAERTETFTGKPTSFTGGGTTLTLPLGQITFEAASLAFKEVFADGVEAIEQGGAGKSFSAIVRPKVTRFTYEYNGLRNAGFAITPTAVVSLSVRLLDAQGVQRWEKTFESGNFEGDTYFISGSPGEEISKATHRAVMKVMQEAADAVQREVKATPSAPSTAQSL